MKARYPFLDLIRGIAILLTIIYHLSFDLNYYHFIEIKINKSTWQFLAFVIVALFFFCVGTSISLVYKNTKLSWKKYFKKLAIIGFYAFIITIVSYLIFPTAGIYFGALQCIFTMYAVLPFFIQIPKVSLLIGVCVITSHILGYLFLGHGIIPWFQIQEYSLDYIPFFPWSAFGFLGIGLFSSNWYKWKPSFLKHFRWLCFAGKYTLAIYLVHQPILFGLISLIYYLLWLK